MKQYNFDFSKKIFYHPEEIVRYKQGHRPFPITVEIDLINCCNHHCVFCNFSEYLKKDHSAINTDTIKKRISEMKHLGTKGICITGGGEPMLYKDFNTILQYTKKCGFDIGLITNGSLINKANVNILVDNLQWIRISMGGGDKKRYEDIEGIDDFDNIIHNIKLLSQTKEQKNKDFNIGIRLLVLEENLDSITNLVNILKDLNINYLQLAPNQFTQDNGTFWNDNYTQIFFKSAGQILNRYNIMLLTSGFSINQDKCIRPQICYAHFFQIAITSEGDVMFCKNTRGNSRKDDRYVIGNINNNNLKEIWNSTCVKDIESWITPSNCGLFCKNMDLNNTLEDIFHPPVDMSVNFVN